MSNSTDKIKLVLDLSNTSSPSALSSESFLHHTQYNKFFLNVADTLNRINNFRTTLIEKKTTQMGYSRVHDVITLHGKRGSGKTTFLLSALGLLKDKPSYDAFMQKVGVEKSLDPSSLCVLDIMDPTLFAHKEHLLHIVLCQINKKIHEHKNNAPPFSCDGSKCSIEEWQVKLAKLSKGLKAVGEMREDSYPKAPIEPRWEDAEFILQNDLDSAQHSMDLEQKFHEIIYFALKILDKKAFVLALDDTDTRPGIGWHILEVLRRYFTTPQLIVIVSGDINLFSAIIRQRHAEELGFSNNSSRIDESPFKERIDNLTEQYLLKILRTQKRINIGNFISAISFMNDTNNILDGIIVTKDIKNENKYASVNDVLSIFYEDIGCTTATEKKIFTQSLLNNSCRTVVQILDACYDRKNNELTQQELAFRLCDIFFSQIQNFGLSPYELQEQLETEHGITILMDNIEDVHESEVSFDFLPKYADTNFNESVIVLQANINNAIKSKLSILFSYMFKACLLRELRNTNEIQLDSYRKIYSYLSLNISSPLHKVVKNMASLSWNLRSESKTISKYGMLRLSGDSKSKNASQAIESMYGMSDDEITPESLPKELKIFRNTIKITSPSLGTLINTPLSLHSNIESWHSDIVHLGFLKVKIANSEYNIFSIFALIAFLGDVLSCENENEIRETLQKASNIEVFYDVSAKIVLETNKDDFDDEFEDDESIAASKDKTEEKTDDASKDFLKALDAWRGKSYPKKSLLFATLASRVMMRFFKTLQNISNTFTIKKIFLGAYIHRCLVAFFNAVLIEEVLLSNNFDKIRKDLKLDNTNTSDIILCQNIEIIENHCTKQKNKDLENTLFYFMFTCPLWKFYLKDIENKENENTASYWYNKFVAYSQEYIHYKSSRNITSHQMKMQPIFNSLYPLLNSISIPKHQIKNTNLTRIGKSLGLPENPKMPPSSKLYRSLDNSFYYYLMKWMDTKEFSRDEPSSQFIEDYSEIIYLHYTSEKIHSVLTTMSNILIFWKYCQNRLNIT